MKPVSIVGAGPGDPALLTRKAVACLRHADLVLYDALVDARVIAIARRARRFYVGKRAGRHAMTQDAIHALMIRAARRGQRVVRLKGGDPFVFGRGGEEALALQAAGIPFEIVPGITSACAAPARAGIPVTHRGLASACLIVSGHDVEAFDAAIAGMPSSALTLVIMMGVAARAELASRLIARGWPPEMPAALIAGAWTEDESVWRGTIAGLAADRAVCDAARAGTIVIGEVAALALVRSGGSLDPPSAEGRSEDRPLRNAALALVRSGGSLDPPSTEGRSEDRPLRTAAGRARS